MEDMKLFWRKLNSIRKKERSQNRLSDSNPVLISCEKRLSSGEEVQQLNTEMMNLLEQHPVPPNRYGHSMGHFMGIKKK